ncbi:MAG: lipoyl(octanoyl) transferase LipB [Bacteroidota bacterium]|nr:lipoyl(octanoyl) transferase LipB [Bacteroidota bacterium]
MQEVVFTDWGLIDYKLAWDQQEELFKTMVDLKFSQRELPETNRTQLRNHLIFCEHPHVYTLGKSGSLENLLLDAEGLKKANASFYPINRGGDITYHGPGQIVGYPIFDLEQFFTDIHKYLRFLEEAVIITLAKYGIKGERFEGLTGVWIDPDKPNARKICAMGVRCSRWITMHGFAFNVNSNLGYFKNIIPCGIDDKGVTSMERELGNPVNIEEVKHLLKQNIALQFGYEEVL